MPIGTPPKLCRICAGSAKAGKSLKGIKSVWVKDMSAKVGKTGKIETYRVTVKLSFEVTD